MATKKDDGGSAFPLPSMKQSGETSTENYLDFEERGQSGMSLRDYFAAKAVIDVVTDTGYWDQRSVANMARQAYQLADAMIKERSK